MFVKAISNEFQEYKDETCTVGLGDMAKNVVDNYHDKCQIIVSF